MKSEFLRVEFLSKTLVHEKVLHNISFHVFADETLAVLGANGAGKTTLINVLGGVSSPDSGGIYIREKPVSLRSPQVARLLGIRVIHDKSNVFDNLSVAENICMGKQKRFFSSSRSCNKEALPYMREVDLADLSPDTMAGELTPTQKVFVELAATFAAKPSLLIFDQSSLFKSREKEFQTLNRTFQKLNGSGTAVLYLTHSIENALKIADRVCVLRGGVSVGTFDRDRWTAERIASVLHPTSTAKMQHEAPGKPEVLLDVRALCGRLFRDVSFHVMRGEILGIHDFEGTVKTDLLNTIYGFSAPKAGGVWLGGRQVLIRDSCDAANHGLAYAPAFSASSGLIDCMSVRENITLTALPRMSTLGWIHAQAERVYAAAMASRMRCDGVALSTPAYRLSEGFQQKMLIARCLAGKPKVLLLDEPFSSMDFAARQEVLRHLSALARGGLSILVASNNLEELHNTCDRILSIKDMGRRAVE